MGEGQALIFTRTKHRAKKLALQLSRAGHSATALQGNLSQNQRDTAMEDFRSGKVKLMVATDIAARGIDISLISHVINFDIPDTPEAYTHRIGRTGRMLRKGTALTLVTPEDHAMLRSIEKIVGSPIERKTLSGFVPAQGEKAPFDARSPKARPERPARSKSASTSRESAFPWKSEAAESRTGNRAPSESRAANPSRSRDGAHARQDGTAARAAHAPRAAQASHAAHAPYASHTAHTAHSAHAAHAAQASHAPQSGRPAKPAAMPSPFTSPYASSSARPGAARGRSQPRVSSRER
jgi:superfamily II DNA/RNA helicase